MTNQNQSYLNEDMSENDQQDSINIEKQNGFGKRHLQVIFLFLAQGCCYMCRSNLSMAIVPMTDNSKNPNFQQFEWNEWTRGIIFSSAYWTLAASIFGGFITEKFGGKIPLLIAIFSTAILTLLTPLFASIHWTVLCVKQVGEGIATGLMFPCVYYLLGKWIHPCERNSLASLTLSGPYIGVIFATIINGLIATSSLGWPGIFYVSGLIGIIWSVLWLIYGGDNPTTYKNISNEEKKFLESIPGKTKNKLKTPWRHIWKTKSVWAYIFAQSAQNWGFVLVLTSTPTYFNDVHQINLKANALFSSMPYILMMFMTLFMSRLAEFVLKFTTIGGQRKLFNTVGMCFPGMFLMILSFMPQNKIAAIMLLTLCVGFTSATNSGFKITALDISPNFAGTIIGIAFAIGSIASFLSPALVGYVVTDTHNPNLWKIIYWVAAGIYFVCNLFFVILYDAKTEIWNNPKADTDDDEHLGSLIKDVETITKPTDKIID